ncbi:hypothetical protein KIL84_012681 [Mauremys mutica]|uniref:Uncharacterized protein n=1 Tax=Mauremys mutica TaxID=74926 RepID=A0A9D4B8U0_9SAUR|nr:hypothetical protein KIL84_012681 [Mauremys mutica]
MVIPEIHPIRKEPGNSHTKHYQRRLTSTTLPDSFISYYPIVKQFLQESCCPNQECPWISLKEKEAAQCTEPKFQMVEAAYGFYRLCSSGELLAPTFHPLPFHPDLILHPLTSVEKLL